jgi:hypothetical protein
MLVLMRSTKELIPHGTNYDETYVSKDFNYRQKSDYHYGRCSAKVYGDTDPGLTAQVTSGVVQGSDVATGSLVSRW